MTDQSRLVRDLLDANLRLTDQFIELARLAIGAPVESVHQVSAYTPDASSGPVQPSEFQLSTTDDWEDIPDQPLGGGAQVIEIPRRELPLHMTEEEEDLRHEVAMGLKPSTELTDFLGRLGLPGAEAVIEFTAPDA